MVLASSSSEMSSVDVGKADGRLMGSMLPLYLSVESFVQIDNTVSKWIGSFWMDINIRFLSVPRICSNP